MTLLIVHRGPHRRLSDKQSDGHHLFLIHPGHDLTTDDSYQCIGRPVPHVISILLNSC